MSPRIATLAALVFSGCFTDAGSGSGSTTGETTSSGSTAATPEPGTTTGGSTSTSSSGEVASSSTATGDESSSGSSGSSGSEFMGCWGSGVPWNVMSIDLDSLAGQLPGSLTLSPNGLRLYYLAGPPGLRRPHRAERDFVGGVFHSGAPLSGWSTAGTDLAQLRVAELGDRLIVRAGSDLGVSSASKGTWDLLSTVTFEAGFEELTDPAIDAFGDEVVFARREELRDGGGEPTLIWALYQAAWPAESPAPVSPERLVLPSFGLEHAQLCPVLSPDGEHLFVGGSFPQTWDTSVSGDLDIFESVSEDGGWSTPNRVESVSSAQQHACPVSVTDNGCELIVRYFDIPFAGNTYMLAWRHRP